MIGSDSFDSLVPEGSIFVVWGPPSHGPRSKVFARALGIPIEFVFGTRRRGALVAPFKYTFQAIATWRLMRSKRPPVVFVQSPPSWAAPIIWLSTRGRGTEVVIDAHSDAMLSARWTRPRALHRAMARRAITTIVTNQHFADEIRSWGAHATIIRDIPTVFPAITAPADPALPADFAVMVVNTFADDEPLDAILGAAAEFDDVVFHVTGDLSRRPVALADALPPNVTFTGFLPDDEYFGMMASTDAVMCLTTRDHTMQRGACEALSMGRPVITSDWPLLREYFDEGTVHVGPATPATIAEGVRRMRADHDAFLRGIARLQDRQRRQWQEAGAILAERFRDAGVGTGDGGTESAIRQ